MDTYELKKEMNCDVLRRKLQRTKTEEDHNSYKKQRNKNNILVRKVKKEYNKKLLTDSANNPQNFCQTIKKMFSSKESVTCSKSYLIDRISHSKPSLIVSKFCIFLQYRRSIKININIVEEFCLVATLSKP